MNIEECLKDIAWVDILSGISSIATVLATIVAYRALNTWKKSALLEKRLDSLDHTSETIFSLYRNLGEALTVVEVQNITIDTPNDHSSIKYYLCNLAQMDSQQLRDVLNKVEPYIDELELSLSKLNRLGEHEQQELMMSFDSIKSIYHKLIMRSQVLRHASTTEMNDKLISRVYVVVGQDISELRNELEASRTNMTRQIEARYKVVIS
ncbi:hypothetical protein [Vibrio vulnificus]|nr:hypothetical protein [Vibrio vulnificus]ELP6989655.1 hypothetical protein [Vibrio vulnificus]MCU8194732.1 hypothetical protein [Vibrio vulnificus]